MRIIKKYEEFLKEAVYAPPPPPPPAIYSTMDMQNAEKADDSGNYMFQTGDTWGKGDNKATQTKKIDSSEWGIPDANLPQTVEGWHSVNDPFIEAYTNYLNDSTGTQQGYVGKTLLIFQKKDGKELGSYVNDNGKLVNTQTEMTYYYVAKDAVKYKVESSFVDGKGNITIFAGEKATRSFDLASGQMLVEKSDYDNLINGDEINTSSEPGVSGKLSGVNIILNSGDNASQRSVTAGIPNSMDIRVNSAEVIQSPGGLVSTDAPILIGRTSLKKNQRVFYINTLGQVSSGASQGFTVVPEVFAKHGAFAKLAVPGAKENQIRPNIEGFGTVYAYNQIYKGTTQGHILYISQTPSEVEDSFGNTAKGDVTDAHYSVPLNVYNPNGEDINVHQPFKTDAGKKALSSTSGKNKVIEVKWDAKSKTFVSDYKVMNAKDVKIPLRSTEWKAL
jgi:hypothetical protein